MKTTFPLILGAALLLLFSCQQKETDELLKQEIMRIQAEARHWVNDNGSYWSGYLRHEMEDEAKRKFRPLVAFLDSIEHTTQQATSQLEVFNEKILRSTADDEQRMPNLSVLRQQLTGWKHELRQHYQGFLREHKTVFHISDQLENEINDYLDQSVDPLNQVVLLEGFSSLNQADQQLAIQSAILDWENVLAILINRLGTGVIGCNRLIYEYTILVAPAQNIIRPGEPFRARIWLAHNDSQYDHHDKEIFVDGVELPVLAGSYAEYVSAPVFGKQKTIHITAAIKDPLTGKMETIFSDFEYTIKTY